MKASDFPDVFDRQCPIMPIECRYLACLEGWTSFVSRRSQSWCYRCCCQPLRDRDAGGSMMYGGPGSVQLIDR